MAEVRIIADPKIMADDEILAASEIPASMEILAELEKQAARLLFRLSKISNCWLLPGPADDHVLLLDDVMNLDHVVPKWEMVPQCPAFMGGLSPELYWLLVPARHAKKWPKSTRQPKVRLPPGILLIPVKSQWSLTQLTSVLSLTRKNIHNHCCCPISANTLTTSKLEAILKIQHTTAHIPLSPCLSIRGVFGGGSMKKFAQAVQNSCHNGL